MTVAEIPKVKLVFGVAAMIVVSAFSVAVGASAALLVSVFTS